MRKIKKAKILLPIIMLLTILPVYNITGLTKVEDTLKKKYDMIYEKNRIPEVVEDNALKEYERLIGRYQFNAIGAGNGVAYGSTKLMAGHSHVPECAEYEGTYSITKNSSGAYLDGKYNENGEIYKAYLMIETTYGWDGIQLKRYPITFLYGGEDGEVKTGIKSTMDILNISNGDNGQRECGVIDVTSFVRQSGYGWYYCCNIPYEDYAQWDCYASWKLIVIEKNEKLPIRLLKLDIGNYIAAFGPINIEVEDENLYTKKEGQVTGQFLFSMAGGDIGNSSGIIEYSESGNINDLKKITTKNNSRTATSPLVLRMLRNGEEIQQKIQYTKPIYSNGKSVKSSKDSEDYILLQGSDLDLFDFENTENHDISIANGINKILFKVTAKSVLSTSALGLVLDIEAPEFVGPQETIVNSDKSATVSRKMINDSDDENMGIAKGELVVKLDEALQADTVIATIYDGKNNLKQITGQIDNENHTVTFKNVDSLKKGAYLEYKIECTITDDEKEVFKNSDSYSGNLYIEGTTIDMYIEDASVSNSQAKAKRKLTIKPNGGIWENSSNDIEMYVEYDKEIKLDYPTKEGYCFENWTYVEKNETIKDEMFIMGMEDRTLIANWSVKKIEEPIQQELTQQAPGILPQTGQKRLISISIILTAIIGAVIYIKYKLLDN